MTQFKRWVVLGVTTPNSGRFVTLNDCSDENEDWASHLFQALTLLVSVTYYIAFRI